MATLTGLLLTLLAAGDIAPVGSPPGRKWGNHKAYAVSAETGIEFELEGPASVLFEFRARSKGKRVVVDIVRDGRFRSRNATKLRLLGHGRYGHRFATLLAFQVPKGKHRYRVRVQGAEVMLIPRTTPKLLRPFIARSERDLEQATREEEVLAQADQTAEQAPTRPDSAPADSGAPADPSDESAVSDSYQDDMFAAEEAAMFGDASDGHDMAGVFTEEISADEAGVRLALADDVLAIGGQFLQMVVTSAPKDPALSDLRLQTPSLVDMYMDARPTDRLRGFVQGRLLFDASVRQDARDLLGRPVPAQQILLDQAWLKADLYRTVFVTVGRQHVRWGTGKFWNPNDLFIAQRRDPLVIVDPRVGVNLLRLHYPIESLGWNFYAVANLEEISRLENVGGALRGEFALGPTESALSVFLRNNERPRFGLDVSAGLWLFDVWAEVLVHQAGQERFFRGNFQPGLGVFPEAYTRGEEWLVQATAGLQLDLPYGDNVAHIGVEGFYNNAGYRDVELYPFLFANRAAEPLYLGEMYAAAYIMLPQPGPFRDSRFWLVGMSNISDGSYLARFEHRVTLLSFLQLTWWAVAHWGQTGELNYSVDLPPVEGVPGLEQSLNIRAPLFQLGVALLLSL